METVNIAVNAVLIVGLGFVLTYIGRDRFDQLQRQVAEQGHKLDALSAEMREGDTQLRTQMREGDTQLRTQMREGDTQLRTQMREGDEQLRAEMREGDEQLRTEMQQGFAQLRSELAQLRSDVTHIALAVGARKRPETG